MDLASTGLRRQPFRTDGKPLVLVPYAAVNAAVGFLEDTFVHRHGLGLFHGPPLSGKTSIIRHFAASLPDDHAVAVTDGAGTRADELLQTLLKGFNFDVDLRLTSERFNMVKVFAMQQAGGGHSPLLVIENAHALKPDALEVLCELAALRVDGQSAMRMILASDQPMSRIVESEPMQEIARRVTGRFLMQPLRRPETAAYVHKKLISGGCNEPARVFPQSVCDALHASSGGWPGVVDRLSVLALAKARKCPVQVAHIPGEHRPDTIAQPGAVPQLILTKRGRTLRRAALDKPRTMIGRAEHNDLCVTGEFISRQHVLFVRDGNTTTVLDMKSRNGTYVNGERISSQVLANNDIISIGECRIKFIDPAATRRHPNRGAGGDETTITKSVGRLRRAVGRMRIVS